MQILIKLAGGCFEICSVWRRAERFIVTQLLGHFFDPFRAENAKNIHKQLLTILYIVNALRATTRILTLTEKQRTNIVTMSGRPGNRDRAVVRALVSHHCGLVSIPSFSSLAPGFSIGRVLYFSLTWKLRIISLSNSTLLVDPHENLL